MPYKELQDKIERVNKTSRSVTIRLMNTTDQKIIEWLDGGEEKPGTMIKRVLREHIPG